MGIIRDHVVMFPWLAMGHMTPFLHLANKLAQKGLSITFLAPRKAIQQLQHLCHYTQLISFHPLVIPHVDGLPPGTETASEIPITMTHFLSIAMDGTRDQVQDIILKTKPKLVIYDIAHWVPEITKPLSIQTMNYIVVSAASIALVLVPARRVRPLSEEELSKPSEGYPSSKIVLRKKEAKSLLFVALPFGEGMTFFERIGPMLPESSGDPLEERWDAWFSRFSTGTVLFCAFGSQHVLDVKQYQELVLGFELTGFPFFIALKPPRGASTVEEALPEGYQERVKDRGVVWGGWVQQMAILRHPSVGCFIHHCGFGSMWESLMSDCQIVLIPHLGDQILNTRLMAEELEVAVEVERNEDGWFSKDGLSRAIVTVMDRDGAVGSKLRENHHKWKSILCNQSLMTSYIDNFFKDVQDIVTSANV